MKDIKAEYYALFNEMPYLLTTQSYDNDEYKMLMENAILRNKPLTEEEIINFFGKDYDDIIIEEN